MKLYYTKGNIQRASCSALKIYFDKKFKQNIGLRTFANILGNAAKIKENFLNKKIRMQKKDSAGKYEEVEIVDGCAKARNNPITDDIIKNNAMELARHLGVSESKLSNGTLSKFKIKKKIKSYNSAGAMASVNLQTYDGMINELKDTKPL